MKDAPTPRLSFRAFALAMLFLLPLANGFSQLPPRIVVHTSGHFLQTEDGRPFFWLGDTAWKLIQSTTPEECSYYLTTRARQGYTVVQTVALAENESILTPNASGEIAFIDQDAKRPNDAFFDRVVAVVDEAASRGLYVALVPAWGDKLTAPWGTGPRIFRNDNLQVARSFGKYLGSRLKGRTNLIWVVGGDRPARLKGINNPGLQSAAKDAGFGPDHDFTPIWTAMGEGIAEGFGTDPLFIYHPQGGPETASIQVPDLSWIDLNGMQSGHGGGHDQPVWEWVSRDYALSPTKPTLDLEPNYEDHPYNPWPSWDPATGWFRDHDVRKQCYRSVSGGAAGVTYGHHSVWQFASKRNGVINFADRDWVSALHRPAATQMIHLRSLLESRPYFTRIPDQSMIVEQPGRDGSLTCVATRDIDGTYAWVYVPDKDLTVRVDLSKMRTATVRAWWFDPRTGFSELIGDFERSRSSAFKSPPHGPDWVLMLEDPTAGYDRPGVPRGRAK